MRRPARRGLPALRRRPRRPGEACDDGNLVDGDGCAGDCTLEASSRACCPGSSATSRWLPSPSGLAPLPHQPLQPAGAPSTRCSRPAQVISCSWAVAAPTRPPCSPPPRASSTT
ncbi:MAG: hypothetical protein R3F60_20770 [bacterium]